MGKYNGAVVTTAGQNLIAQAIAGGNTVTWTTAEASSYAYPSTTDFQSLTSLQNVEQAADITGAYVYSENVIQVTTRFDNDGVEEAYLINTIGVYAQVGTDAPVLAAVVTAVTPDQMPVEDPQSPSAFVYNIQLTINNAAQIQINVNPAGTVNVDQLNQYIEKAGGEAGATVVSFTDSDLDSGITSFPIFLSKIISGIPMARFMRDFVEGMQFVLHVGSLQNNGITTEAGKYALDAAYGKVLRDDIDSLNSSLRWTQAGFTQDKTVSIPLPSSFNELTARVHVIVSNVKYKYSFRIIRADLEQVETRYVAGFNNGLRNQCIIGATIASVRIVELEFNSTNPVNYELRVWTR